MIKFYKAKQVVNFLFLNPMSEAYIAAPIYPNDTWTCMLDIHLG